MRFAVVDDEPGILSQIPLLIEKLMPEATAQTECFQNAADFLKIYTKQKYDALFLDIDMPDMNGFDLAKHLRDMKDDVPIVYITARDDLIIQAFRYKVLGFVRKQYMERELPFAISTILAEVQKHKHLITVTEIRAAGGKTHTISIDQIMYIESIKHNVTIHLTDNRELIVRNPLTYYSENTGFENFVLINSGTIVNLSIIKLTADKVIFDNGMELFISRRRIRCVRDAYLKFIKKVLI